MTRRVLGRTLTEALSVEDIPSLPKWIMQIVERGEVDKALKFVTYLNESDDSPWKGKILMANAVADDDTTINQRTFVKAIVKYVLTANNPLAVLKDFDLEKKIFLNYWKAIAKLLNDGEDSVLFKYNGVELFCKFSTPFFTKLHDRGKYTVPMMEGLLTECFDNVEGEYAGVGHPEWWAKGSNASYLNAAAVNVVYSEMSKVLNKISMGTGPIET